MQELQGSKRKIAQDEVESQQICKERNSLKANLDDANRKLSGAQDDIQTRQRLVEELQYKFESLSRDFSLRDGVIDRIKLERRSVEDELKQCGNDLERLTNEVKTAMRDNEKLKHELSNAQQKFTEADVIVRKTRTERDQIQRDFTLLERSVVELRDLSHKLQNEKEDAVRELYTISKRLSTTEDENEGLARENQELDRELQSHRNRASQFEIQLQELRRREVQMKTQIDDALKNREELVRMRNVVNDYQRRLEVTTRELEQKNTSFTQVKTDRDAMKRDIERIVRELESAKSSLDTAVKDKDRYVILLVIQFSIFLVLLVVSSILSSSS